MMLEGAAGERGGRAGAGAGTLASASALSAAVGELAADIAREAKLPAHEAATEEEGGGGAPGAASMALRAAAIRGCGDRGAGRSRRWVEEREGSFHLRVLV
jgi:hypothetical protein